VNERAEADVQADLGVVFGVPSSRLDLGVAAVRLGVRLLAKTHTHTDTDTFSMANFMRT